MAHQGVFPQQLIDLYIKRQKSSKPDSVSLPDRIIYLVPPELANNFKDPSGAIRHVVGANQTSTLAQKVLTSILYMDVGRWGGSAAGREGTREHWGRRRDFGLVCGRAAVLCSYVRDGAGTDPDLGGADAAVQSSPDFQKVVPLLKALSARASLGRVAVTKALVGRVQPGQSPSTDRIHVFLGDLHAPIMTDPTATYSGVKPEPAVYEWHDTTSLPPGGMVPVPPKVRVKVKDASKHPWRGRYNPGLIVNTLLPTVATLLGGITDEASSTSDKVISGAALAGQIRPIIAILLSMETEVMLDGWPDPEAAEAPDVEDWFERFHGKSGRGAEIFEHAGADLKDWLELLISYQSGTPATPIRLVQLGDLFDLWIGLKCAFSRTGGATVFPDAAAARAFAEYWRDQSYLVTDQHEAIHLLWKFDDYLPAGKKCNPVYCYGNHDNYLGTLLGSPERFTEEKGLVAQHGHQEDSFNSNANAHIGYLLTQAAFAVPALRVIEDPLAALIATLPLVGGNGSRLDLVEMALEECVWKDTNDPRLTFVMGHTHEAMLKEVLLLEYLPAEPKPSPPPSDYGPPTPLPAGQKARATVTFRQLHINDDGHILNVKWTFVAFLCRETISQTGTWHERLVLFEDRVVKTNETIPLTGTVEIDIGRDDWMLIETRVIDDDDNPVLSETVSVSPMNWGGTRTMKHKGPNGEYLATFDLRWTPVSDAKAP